MSSGSVKPTYTGLFAFIELAFSLHSLNTVLILKDPQQSHVSFTLKLISPLNKMGLVKAHIISLPYISVYTFNFNVWKIQKKIPRGTEYLKFHPNEPFIIVQGVNGVEWGNFFDLLLNKAKSLKQESWFWTSISFCNSLQQRPQFVIGVTTSNVIYNSFWAINNDY